MGILQAFSQDFSNTPATFIRPLLDYLFAQLSQFS